MSEEEGTKDMQTLEEFKKATQQWRTNYCKEPLNGTFHKLFVHVGITSSGAGLCPVAHRY